MENVKKFYKLRHKGTGLFFKPAKYGHKNNLSEIGKSYTKKPCYDWVRQIYVHKEGDLTYFTKLIKTNISDWEVVEYLTIENNVYDL